MIKLPGYQIEEQIFGGEKTIVYRAQSKNGPVILKYLNYDFPAPEILAEFMREYEVTKSLQGNPGIVKLKSLERYENSYVLVFEDLGGVSIANHLRDLGKFSIAEFLNIAEKVVKALEYLHNDKLIHKDIKPQNINYNRNNGTVELLDFGSVGFLTRENVSVSFKHGLAGTIMYTSPEQTGRMNRNVDYRTDFYSLGITFYQMLTGKLPFSSRDSMELIHAHIAKTPKAPKAIDPSIPEVLSRLILKLMEKNPEDRYQTCASLSLHLSEIKKVINSPTLLEKIELVEKKIDGRFHIPEKLYGRLESTRTILKSFQRANEGALEVLLVEGPSGIGKTALINEVNKPITAFKGHFVSGKFDAFKRDMPYRAFVYSLRQLINQILTEPKDSIVQWKEKIVSAVQPNGQALIEVVPELEVLIGKQPSLTELPPAESQNRFNLTFLAFLKTFCSKDHPLVIFLDDVQWADLASLTLLQSMITSGDIKNLLLILSFRDNEVNAGHPFSLMLDEIAKFGVVPHRLQVQPLTLKDVELLVSDTLHQNPEAIQELAREIHTRTGGNPFFVTELFSKLNQDNLVHFSASDNIWKYDLNKIKHLEISPNVVELVIAKIRILDNQKQDALKLAGCIGNWFRVSTFQEIIKGSNIGIRDLYNLANDGFLMIGNNECRFTHDKVREATYAIISEDEKTKYHYRIGHTYLGMVKSGSHSLDDHIFTIIIQLNQCIPLLTPEERIKLAWLNLKGGKKALASVAYESALRYLAIGKSLVPSNYWKEDYALTMGLSRESAIAEYLNGNYATAEKEFQQILSNDSIDFLDKISIYEIIIALYTAQNRMSDALAKGLAALELLGFPLATNPNDNPLVANLTEIATLVGDSPVESLLSRPSIPSDSLDGYKAFAAMSILSACAAPAYISNPAMFPVIVTQMAIITLKFGNSPFAAISYVFYGVILASGMANYESGFRFGNLAIDLLKKYKEENTKCRVLFIYAVMINHWVNHAKENQAILLDSYRSGIDNGDVLYASYSINHLVMQSLLIRETLKDSVEKYEKYLPTMLSLQQADTNNAYFMWGCAAKLLSTTETPTTLKLKNEFFDEDALLPVWIETNHSTSLHFYYPLKAMIFYILGEYEACLQATESAKPHAGGVASMMMLPENCFWSSLALNQIIQTASLDPKNADPEKTKSLHELLKSNLEQMTPWAQSCPANYGHKLEIIRGIVAYHAGETESARLHYKAAIALAKQNDFILEEAIANELTVWIWEKTDDLYASVHLIQAHYAYKLWGCEIKAQSMEDQYPEIIRPATRKAEVTLRTITIDRASASSSSTGGKYFDLKSLIKASQAISGEIQLGRLLETMMKIVFENAGAERGCFVLKEEDRWQIEAEGDTNQDFVQVLQSKPLDGATELAVNITNYVIRTKGVVLLNDAANEGMFVNDSYIRKNQPKSVLCYPIVNHGAIIAVMYLENNLTTDAFTPDRLETLRLLSAQIAVSLENSLVYTNLEEKVQQRTSDLTLALGEVRALKEQQDMDYFLNTLLIEPLNKNTASHPNITVESLVRQKKRFLFRNREWELGGDINIAENMELRGKEYLIFVNGDAMGKSIQGAGGVLVLGTIVKSIIQRTISTDYGKHVYPERWLKNTYVEVHKAFESFDGSMLMSAVFGLIDLGTGTLYFINAMHPDIVLFRSGKARYLESRSKLRKLGHNDTSDDIFLEVIQLLHGDVVICGTDGRDDVSLADNHGKAEIDNDETFFLEHTNKGQGKLKSIFQSITSIGTLMDDLALLRIGWQELSSIAETEDLTQQLVILDQEIKDQNDARIVEVGESLLFRQPALTRYLFDLSVAYSNLGDLESAIDNAERLRLREPRNEKNFVHLIKIYRMAGNHERANKVLDLALSILPHSDALRELWQTAKI